MGYTIELKKGLKEPLLNLEISHQIQHTKDTIMKRKSQVNNG